MEPGERIRQERERRGWSQADMAQRLGISQVAIKKIEDGGTRKSRYLANISTLLSIPYSDLDPDQDDTVSYDPIPAPQLLGERDFPIRAAAEGGPGQIIVDSDPVDWAPRPAPLRHVRNAYGLLISGTSMEPEYRPGDTALVNPHLPIIGGEVYIFYADKEGEAKATIKHLRRATVEAWHVTQWNPPEAMKADFTLARKEWQWAHRVLGKYSRR